MSSETRTRRPVRRPSRLAAWRDRLARSSRVFLAGLIVACGIEVLVDWNATLFEVNVLRDRMRERGQSYVAILAHAAQPAALARDGGELGRLSAGLFDDADVVFVRFTDDAGATMFERLRPEYDARFARQKGASFPAYYGAQIERDVRGIVRDPQGLRERMQHSRHRDFVQAWNDLVNSVVQRFAPAPPPPRRANDVLYQDRLRTPSREHDADVTYALGTIVDGAGRAGAVVLVAFDMGRINAAVRTKYLKGLGMVVFFVALILVQNVSARRDKLRLLDVERRYGAARRAVLDAVPAALDAGTLHVTGALEQSAGSVDGLIWDCALRGETLEIVVIDPQGDGIDAAAVALHVQRAYRARRARGENGTLDDELTTLGRTAEEIPLSRPVGVALVRIGIRDGEVRALSSPMGGIRVLDGATRALTATPHAGDVPLGIVGPVQELQGVLPVRGRLLIACDGLAEGAHAMDVGAVVGFFERVARAGSQDAATLVADAVTWARGRSAALGASDLLVVSVARAPSPP